MQKFTVTVSLPTTITPPKLKLSLKSLQTVKAGITSDAYLEVYLSDQLPSQLFYKFENENLNLLLAVMGELAIDDDVNEYNQIDIVPNEYSGNYTVTGVGSESFEYNVSVALVFSHTTPLMLLSSIQRLLGLRKVVCVTQVLQRWWWIQVTPWFQFYRKCEGTGAPLSLLDPQLSVVS